MTTTTCTTSHPVTGTHGQWGEGVGGARPVGGVCVFEGEHEMDNTSGGL